MKLSQEEINVLYRALRNAKELIKNLEGAIAYQKADTDKVKPFLKDAQYLARNLSDNLQFWVDAL